MKNLPYNLCWKHQIQNPRQVKTCYFGSARTPLNNYTKLNYQITPKISCRCEWHFQRRLDFSPSSHRFLTSIRYVKETLESLAPQTRYSCTGDSFHHTVGNKRGKNAHEVTIVIVTTNMYNFYNKDGYIDYLWHR